MPKPPVVLQFIEFALVGCVAAVGHYGMLIVLSEVVGISPVPASGAGFTVGAAISYVLNYQLVFRSDKSHMPTAAKFLAVAVLGLLLNSVIMALLAEGAGIHYLPAQITATVVVMAWSYLGNRGWTFAPGKAES